jgi:leucyl-tRNA synthetase
VFSVSEEALTKPELKVVHATLKKVTEDIERMSFNTSVAQFMIAANELGILNRVLETIGLTMEQWIISIAVSLTVLVVVEAVKAIGVKPGEEDEAPPSAASEPAAA